MVVVTGRLRPPGWLAAVALVVVVALTAQVVADVGIVVVDRHVRDWVLGHRVADLQQVCRFFTDVISPPVDVAVLLVLGAWWRRLPAAIVTVAALAAGVLSLKYGVGRPNPDSALSSQAFPSGHTASVLACAGTIVALTPVSGRLRKVLWVAVGCLTTVIAAALVYMNVHWLSDVIAGAAVAVLVLWFTPRVTGR